MARSQSATPPLPVADDFAYIVERVPAAFIAIGAVIDSAGAPDGVAAEALI